MSEPTTGAGKRLLDWLDSSSYRALRPYLGIAAIEAEAVAAERARITAAVEALPRWIDMLSNADGIVDLNETVSLTAVLAAIEGPTDE